MPYFMKTLKSISLTIILLIAGTCFNACSVSYSFTGISTDAETVTIEFFKSRAPLAPPTYSQAFSEALKDIFIQQTSIDLVSSGGDLHFEGEIVGYENRPAGVGGNQQAALNRLTITVKVKFTNFLNEEDNFEQTFSRFEDYSANESLKQVEDRLIEEINTQLTQDILQKAVGNW